MSEKLKLITEEDEVKFKKEEDLSYFDDGGDTVSLYVKDKLVGKCKVWKDSEMDDREYLTINYTITYLDTIKKR